MHHLNGRNRRAAYNVVGNVVWLTYPVRGRYLRHEDPLASLEQSVTRLIGEIERSGRIQSDIAAAVEKRRYELYRRSVTVGSRASDCSLAAAQRTHVGSLLTFVYAVAAAGSDHRDAKRKPAAQLDALTLSIRKLEASLERTRELSRDVLTQCQRRDWRDSRSPLGHRQH